MNAALPVAERLLALEEMVAVLAAQVAALGRVEVEATVALSRTTEKAFNRKERKERKEKEEKEENEEKEEKEEKEDDSQPGDLSNLG